MIDKLKMVEPVFVIFLGVLYLGTSLIWGINGYSWIGLEQVHNLNLVLLGMVSMGVLSITIKDIPVGLRLFLNRNKKTVTVREIEHFLTKLGYSVDDVAMVLTPDNRFDTMQGFLETAVLADCGGDVTFDGYQLVMRDRVLIFAADLDALGKTKCFLTTMQKDSLRTEAVIAVQRYMYENTEWRPSNIRTMKVFDDRTEIAFKNGRVVTVSCKSVIKDE